MTAAPVMIHFYMSLFLYMSFLVITLLINQHVCNCHATRLDPKHLFFFILALNVLWILYRTCSWLHSTITNSQSNL